MSGHNDCHEFRLSTVWNVNNFTSHVMSLSWFFIWYSLNVFVYAIVIVFFKHGSVSGTYPWGNESGVFGGLNASLVGLYGGDNPRKCMTAAVLFKNIYQVNCAEIRGCKQVKGLVWTAKKNYPSSWHSNFNSWKLPPKFKSKTLCICSTFELIITFVFHLVIFCQGAPTSLHSSRACEKAVGALPITRWGPKELLLVLFPFI